MRRPGGRQVGAVKETSQSHPGTSLLQNISSRFSNEYLNCLVIRIRPSRAVRAIEPVAGPSKSPRGKSKEKKRAAKGKSREVWVVEEMGRPDEDEAMRRQHIATQIVEKKVEIEMLWKEIEGLEEMLEE